MSPLKKFVMPALVAMALLPAAPLGAVPTTIYLTAFVPIYCNVDLVPAPSTAGADGLINLGTSHELCNAPHGYRIILEHPTNMVDAAIISDANRIPLSQSGETVVWNSDQPGLESRQLALDLGHDPAAISQLGLRIEVKY
jgi:hypothetical protein